MRRKCPQTKCWKWQMSTARNWTTPPSLCPKFFCDLASLAGVLTLCEKILWCFFLMVAPEWLSFAMSNP